MKKLISLILACIIVIGNITSTTEIKADSKECTVSLASYGEKITYEDRALVLHDAKKQLYRVDDDGCYLIVDLSGAEVNGKKLSGKVITEVYYLADYLLSLGYDEKDIPNLTCGSKTEAEYKNGKVTKAIRYTYDVDKDHNKLETTAFYKKNKLQLTVWSISVDNFSLKDKNVAFKLWNQSTKTFKKKAKDAPDYRLIKKKGIKKYVGKQYTDDLLNVVEVYEDQFNDDYFTFVHVVGSNGNRYMLVMDGKNDILEGDYVNVWFTPTASGYYDTISGDQMFTVYGLCKAIEKVY